MPGAPSSVLLFLVVRPGAPIVAFLFIIRHMREKEANNNGLQPTQCSEIEQSVLCVLQHNAAGLVTHGDVLVKLSFQKHLGTKSFVQALLPESFPRRL